MKRAEAAFQRHCLLAHRDRIRPARKEEQYLRRRIARSGKQVGARNGDLASALDAATLLDGLEHAFVGIGHFLSVTTLRRRQQRHSLKPDRIEPRGFLRHFRTAGKTDGHRAFPACEHPELHGLAGVGAWNRRRALTDRRREHLLPVSPRPRRFRLDLRASVRHRNARFLPAPKGTVRAESASPRYSSRRGLYFPRIPCARPVERGTPAMSSRPVAGAFVFGA